MKTAVSIPEDVFKSAENLAQEKGWSRSRLYAEAVSQFVRCHRGEDITKNLNALYAHEDSHMETSAMEMQEASISEDEW